MKCILCDRCKKVIEDPQQRRVITCARPLRPRPHPEGGNPPYRGDDRQMNDIIWEKDLCTACAAEMEAFIPPALSGSNGCTCSGSASATGSSSGGVQGP